MVSNLRLYAGAESGERRVVVLVDTGYKLILDDGAVPVPILSVLLGTPGRRN